jgi:hypothetical protein
MLTDLSCRFSADGTKVTLEGKSLVIHVDPKKKQLDGATPVEATGPRRSKKFCSPQGEYQMGEVHARSATCFGTRESSHAAGRIIGGLARHRRWLHRQVGASTTRA